MNETIARMDAIFSRMYGTDARAVPPERRSGEAFISALMLQVLYSIRSECMLMKQISYNMLF